MQDERHFVGFPRFARLLEKFRDREYRHSYMVAHTRRFLARQMRKFRGEKSQEVFGEMIGKQQTVVSRLEDPAYGKATLQTLFDVAEKLDVAVFVRFVDRRTFLKLSEDMSDEASRPLDYESSERSKEKELASGDAIRAYTEGMKAAFVQCDPVPKRWFDSAANQNDAFRDESTARGA